MQYPDPKSLDNPTWSALRTRQSSLGLERGKAMRYLADIAPFAAIEEQTPAALVDLHELLRPGGHVLVQTLVDLPSQANLTIDLVGVICQMVAPERPNSPVSTDFVTLTEMDSEAMQLLAAKTRPGPFGPRTHEMGNYIGLIAQNSLVAMAGERMNLEGYVEISAVCVDPDLRGRGMAAQLMNALRHQILDRGDVPFLHVLKDNLTAIALYERLGLQTRREFNLYKIAAVT